MGDQVEDAARAREEARHQVKAIRGFYTHTVVYVAVILMLIVVNIADGDAARGDWWVQWPAMTWGVLVFLHGIFALQGSFIFGPEWEERKIEEILRQRQERQ